ncbi:hypothetical protein [Marinobacter persicus]|uniref:ATP-binding protein n=1 Tax=Marinobacter persicus TaxID=930118 RepID=A0A2S6G5W2_9GAMM|nr:hypothetical protein [Marinobacter persicus]PPK51246.1 hypothetical protein BY455_11442 [Marinobacter persicus]PPK54515.1 hypothetical protein B0H24_101342 [Marinobacter persicus]PPK57841.1 hypothetical protein BY454_11542 [Marinobacter persicus]
MKKQGFDDRIRQQRIARDRYKRRFRKLPSSKRTGGLLPSWRIGNSEVIAAPSKLELNSEYVRSVCLDFVSKVEDSLSNNRVYIDFSRLEEISAPVIVYLYARFEGLKEKYGGDYLRLHKLPRHKSARNHLCWSGLESLLRGNELVVDFNSKDVIPVFSGFDTRHDDIVTYVNAKVYDGEMPATDQWVMGDALSEAFNNVFQHAYPNYAEDKRKWWAICNVIDNQLFLSIYDDGIGIPNSILRPNSWIRKIYSLEHLMAIKKHSRKIKLAMQSGENRRDEEKHGQGSESFRQLIKENPEGELWVLSGKGMYINFQDQGKDVEDIAEFKRPLSGTLVQWNIKVGRSHA